MTVRILLADDHPRILENLSRPADEVGEVVGAVQGGGAAVVESRRVHPDAIVLDPAMPVVGGVDAARRLRCDVPASRVIVCTIHTSSAVIDDGSQPGVQGSYGSHQPIRTWGR
jgi:DNA-binding NarL/FixJ family response regulator